MHYFIGDIHGYYNRLTSLLEKLEGILGPDDTLVFLGDYIDRGPQSYEVIDLMVALSQSRDFNTVFLKGNHEDMLFNYLAGNDRSEIYIINGGDATIASYEKRCGSLTLPPHHRKFFDSLRLYYEGEDFIAVHAGLNPRIEKLSAQSEYDLLWIREDFYRADRRWAKTVIFGHTPVSFIAGGSDVHHDDERNIIGIDSGVIYGLSLLCLRWPDGKIIKSA